MRPGAPIPNGFNIIADYAGEPLAPIGGRVEIESVLLNAGEGARGIVYGTDGDTAHVWNGTRRPSERYRLSGFASERRSLFRPLDQLCVCEDKLRVTLEEAFGRAQTYLDERVRPLHSYEILIANCVETPEVWAFTYNTREFFAGDFTKGLIGSGCIVVPKSGEETRATSSHEFKFPRP